jgi:hypothetical protein
VSGIIGLARGAAGFWFAASPSVLLAGHQSKYRLLSSITT